MSTDLKPIASKLGVPDTEEHILQRIEELHTSIEKDNILKKWILQEVDEGRKVDLGCVDRDELYQIVRNFRKNYWKLKARFDHCHELAYEPWIKVTARRFHGFFIYPIARLFRKGL